MRPRCCLTRGWVARKMRVDDSSAVAGEGVDLLPERCCGRFHRHGGGLRSGCGAAGDAGHAGAHADAHGHCATSGAVTAILPAAGAEVGPVRLVSEASRRFTTCGRPGHLLPLLPDNELLRSTVSR